MPTAVDERTALLLLSADDAVDLTLAYIAELDAIAAEVGAFTRAAFADLLRTDRADIAKFITEAEPFVLAGVDEGADLAAAYISELSATSVTASDVTAPVIKWDDPFKRTWHQLSEGAEYAAAKESGASVAEMVGRDATLDGASSRMGKPGTAVRGWRRVINAKACKWCQAVATQLYRTQETATFGHHGCQCKPVAVPFGFDPGAEINRLRLKELKAEGTMDRVNAARVRSRGRERAAALARAT